jgi:hypothetical protein
VGGKKLNEKNNADEMDWISPQQTCVLELFKKKKKKERFQKFGMRK